MRSRLLSHVSSSSSSLSLETIGENVPSHKAPLLQDCRQRIEALRQDLVDHEWRRGRREESCGRLQKRFCKDLLLRRCAAHEQPRRRGGSADASAPPPRRRVGGYRDDSSLPSTAKHMMPLQRPKSCRGPADDMSLEGAFTAAVSSAASAAGLGEGLLGSSGLVGRVAANAATQTLGTAPAAAISLPAFRSSGCGGGSSHGGSGPDDRADIASACVVGASTDGVRNRHAAASTVASASSAAAPPMAHSATTGKLPTFGVACVSASSGNVDSAGDGATAPAGADPRVAAISEAVAAAWMAAAKDGGIPVRYQDSPQASAVVAIAVGKAATASQDAAVHTTGRRRFPLTSSASAPRLATVTPSPLATVLADGGGGGGDAAGDVMVTWRWPALAPPCSPAKVSRPESPGAADAVVAGIAASACSGGRCVAASPAARGRDRHVDRCGAVGCDADRRNVRPRCWSAAARAARA